MIRCMRRTNVYLAEEQCSALDELARSAGTSRAELIRRLIDQAVLSDVHDAEADVAAILETFGALRDEEIVFDRGPDGRAEHLEMIARR